MTTKIVTEPTAKVKRPGIPYPVTFEERAAYGPLYRRYVAARRSGLNEQADWLVSEYRRITRADEDQQFAIECAHQRVFQGKCINCGISV